MCNTLLPLQIGVTRAGCSCLAISRLLSTRVMDKRVAPEWKMPVPEVKVDLPPLKLYNSLSNSKVAFVPKRGKDVTWYCCGPTVYDSSHMGHARSYISFDIIRRVLVDYFGFNVKYVMNITDIDDKIIKKARQNYLIESYFKCASSFSQVKEDIRAAVKLLEAKSKTHPEPDQREYLKREVSRIRTLLTSRTSVMGMLTGAQDALAAYLDAKHGSSISDYEIFEALPRRMEEEFRDDMRSLNVLEADKLTRVSEYIEPIIAYIERIIYNGFAYAVESGSVYFNTKKFAETEGHFYAKLVPTAYGDAAKLASGEGDLSTTEAEKRNFSDFALWKASKPGEPAWPSPWGRGRPGWHIECSVMASDTIGESVDIHTGGVDLKFPHHDNELAQAEAYFGHSHWVSYFLHAGHLTISGCKMSKSLKNFITVRDALKQHSARELRFAFLLHSWRDTLDYGVDTMNQAIAFNKTITDFLFNVSHTLRLLSSSKYATTMDLPDNQDLSNALSTAEKEVFEALCDSIDTKRAMLAIRELINASNQVECAQPLVSGSMHLLPRAQQCYALAAFILRLLCVFGAADRTALADAWVASYHSSPSVNGNPWPISRDYVVKAASKPLWVSMVAPKKETLAAAFHGTALACKQFVREVHDVASNARDVAALLSNFETTLKRDFNLDLNNMSNDANAVFDTALKQALGECATLKRVQMGEVEALETEAWPVVARLLYATADLRQGVRLLAQSGGPLKVQLLTTCDRLRDDYLPVHGIRLQDRADIATDKADLPAIGLVEAKLLTTERREKAERAAEKAAAKAIRLLAKMEAGKQPPSEMFRSQIDKFSAFDEKGMPTHDATGKEISKSQLKKLQKMYDAQAKRHEDYLTSLDS
ncbi:Cysteine--tRNA ligase, cytoplasmic [Echinococcus granulosus]|nr:Cysteine--tRNA ligase, cytoplasmic [Echinococcus granulosus]